MAPKTYSKRKAAAPTMAGVITVTKTRPAVQAVTEAQTSVEQVIQLKQSTETVQTLLLGSVSCLAYMRGFFSEDCFDDRYDDRTRYISYREFADGSVLNSKESMLAKSRGSRGTSMKVLQSGRNEGADKLLEWIEHGVFDAIQLGVLRGMQLNVFEDQNNPSKALETYTFTIRYVESASKGVLVAGLEIQGPRGQSVTVKSARTGLQQLIRQLVSLCSTLPSLPSQRYLTMHLFYNEKCEPDYEPPGFVPSGTDTISYPESENWKLQVTGCGSLDVGFYSLSLNVKHLIRVPDSENENGEFAEDKIPSDLEYTHEMLREDTLTEPPSAVEVPCQAIEGTSQEKDAENRAPISEETPVAEAEEEVEKQRDEIAPDSFPNADKPREPRQEAEIQDATQGILEAKLYFNRILNPVEQLQGQEATQRMDDAPTKTNEKAPNVSSIQVPGFELSQSVAEALKKRQKPLVSRPNKKDDASSSLPDLRDDVPLCECGLDKEQGQMVHCEFCDTWQHISCYGHRSVDTLPKVHVCYRCLLQDKDEPLLQELKNTTLLRRALALIEEFRFYNDKSFSELLHCDLQTTGSVTKHLRKEGFIVDTPESKKKGFAATGKPRSIIVQKEPARSRMLKKYFDPLARIAHYYDVQAHGEATTTISKVTQLPPPPQDTDLASLTQLPADTCQASPTQYPIDQKAAQPALSVLESSFFPDTQLATVPTEPAPPAPQATMQCLQPLPVRQLAGRGTLRSSQTPHPVEVAQTPSRKRSARMAALLPYKTPQRKRLKSSTTEKLIDVGSVSPNSVAETQDEL